MKLTQEEKMLAERDVQERFSTERQGNLVSPDTVEKREGEFDGSTGTDTATNQVVQQALDALEEEGLMRKTGDFVRGQSRRLASCLYPHNSC